MTPRVAVHDTGIELRPDVARVIARFFVPGREDMGVGDSRAAPVAHRIMALDEQQVDAAMADVDQRFAHRHRDLHGLLREHAALMMSRIESGAGLSTARHLLLGASFTSEYAIEAAALCNPSAVLHPAQDGDGVRFVMSVRGIGEGHRSSIGFRTGRVALDGTVSVDPAGPFPQTASATPGLNHRDVFHAKLAELGDDRENAAFVLDPLPLQFDDRELAARIESLHADLATRPHTAATIAKLRVLAESSYRVEFPTTTELSERVLWPQAPAERQGVEDARFVRFTDDAGIVTYYGTYTAYDGANIAQQLITTTDFVSFSMAPMAGAAAMGKGMALFPRKIAGSYVALSRSDRETNAVAFSTDLHCWPDSTSVQLPVRAWEVLQLGNCGSPIETDAGWLVLTHGVGPMRTYALGALLLDRHDPERVLATLDEPFLTPSAERRDGYVPNVVYTCGGFAVGDTLVLPYGVADQTIAVATLSIGQLIGAMRPAP